MTNRVLLVVGSTTWMCWLPEFVEDSSYTVEYISHRDFDSACISNKFFSQVVFLSHSDTLMLDSSLATELARDSLAKIVCQPKSIALLAANKSKMTQFAENISGLATIQAFGIDTAREVLRKFAFSTIVMKRIDSSEGRGMRYINSIGDLDDELNKSEYLFQEFIYGEELSVIALCQKGQYTFFPVVSKGNTGVGAVHPSKRTRISPANLDETWHKRIINASRLYLDAINPEGIVEIEYIRTKDRLFFLEINPRLAATMRLCSVAAMRSIFVELIKATTDTERVTSVLQARQFAIEWYFAPEMRERIAEIVRFRKDAWISTSRITVAAKTYEELRSKEQAIRLQIGNT